MGGGRVAVLTHSLFPTLSRPLAVMPFQSRLRGCCYDRPIAGSLASGLDGCNTHTEYI